MRIRVPASGPVALGWGFWEFAFVVKFSLMLLVQVAYFQKLCGKRIIDSSIEFIFTFHIHSSSHSFIHSSIY
jgi:hypothetical protein